MSRTAYLHRGSPIHRLDPRTKILGFVVLSTLPFVFNSPLYVAVICLGVIGLGAIAGSLENLFRIRHLLVVFLIVTFAAWQVYLQGPTVVGYLGPLTLTREALLYGLAAGIRVATVVMVGMLFVSTTKVEELLHGLIRLGMPYRIGFVLSLTARLIPTLASTLTTIVQAQVARGLDLDTRNPLRRAKRLAPVVVPFLISMVRHAAMLPLALEAKGFRPHVKRTYLIELRMTPRDWYGLLGLTASTVACLALRFSGHGAVLPGRI